MKFILAKKLEMTEVFDDQGKVTPVTLVKAGPVIVTQVKEKERDGYRAVQVGFDERKEKRMKKPQKGHFKNLGNFRYAKEFRLKKEGEMPFELGAKIDVSVFQEGDAVQVSSVSKGRGFQGVVKRHGFAGGQRTRGQKHSEREPGSIGATWPQRVIKGMRMAGRMGNKRITIKNLKIVKVDSANNILAIKGAIPGARGALVEIRG